ncbi:TPA: ABC transporter permease subunit [Legionella pneumophila]|uniref:ABC transporter, permease protein n=2 Tax=Legionella pneumophila TaxID=446 RepID=Q5ZZ90_LEGPH|nr:ABC transporter permease subunit [Legionella pneumophila]AAU26228.1 ABC transporter, permease protein [Legionella pneumophila subsp. pneumophila str. Philadelphia 1]AEW50409.1 ABC transporter, permease protein [Legionella pneumophila subsp. pneumophila ATCC 43290]AGH55208.1 ABC-type anion transport system, duplicated permease component [Legionella pneumophila subsp. pneumophila LPE509]AMV12826.1 Glycine betaine transport system permease protein OpuAB [Legionella pneumophila]MBN5928669.1 ABC
MGNSRFYFANPDKFSRFINRWDLLLLILTFSVLFFLGWAGSQMATPYQLGDQIPISLEPSNLPFYALRTVLRMFIALIFSILFTFIVGALAAKNRRAEQIVIPAIDILQSIPVLSFLSITVTGFIHLFPNSLLGPECASIFAIFSAQVWNMTFGFYQSLKTVPHDLIEVSAMFRLSAWQRFWKVEVPFSMSGLLWNMMVSMSASWFFVVLSEAISVAHQNIRLPGVGSYIALAIAQRDLHAVGYAILTMVIVIFLYDQILFRPLIAWSEKFKMEQSPDESEYQSWLIDLIRSSRLMKRVTEWLAVFTNSFVNARWLRIGEVKAVKEIDFKRQKRLDRLWTALVLIAVITGGWFLLKFILAELKVSDIFHVFLLGAATGSRVIILILLSSMLWIPVGVWIGLRPRLAQKIQPIIQFVAAFPANLFYPLFVIAIVKFNLSVEIWVTPLMILGTQWYILFNVIAGASSIPRDLYLAADNFGLKGWIWWKRLALPGIFPFYITGAITAAGGAWNASIVAEYVSWGNITLKATGLGEYIQASTTAGDFPQIALGTAMMCVYVLAFNHLIWRPLYRLAEERFNFN